ncbi:MAG: hypothetical protein FJ311_06255 [Rhodospirillales bacterium]|nr:hypothetical protein [Rhodospirillales bacterium]
MRKIRPRRIRRNLEILPLLAWIEARDQRFSLAARLLAVRHRLPLARAALVAELAGIGQGGER